MLQKLFESLEIPRPNEHTPTVYVHTCINLIIVLNALKQQHIQGGPKKVNPKCSTHNFVKYWPILKILSLL